MTDTLGPHAMDTGAIYLSSQMFNGTDSTAVANLPRVPSDVDALSQVLRGIEVYDESKFIVFHTALTSGEDHKSVEDAHWNSIDYQCTAYEQGVRAWRNQIVHRLLSLPAPLATAGQSDDIRAYVVGPQISRRTSEGPRVRALTSSSHELQQYLADVRQRFEHVGEDPDDEIDPRAIERAIAALAASADPHSILPSVSADGERGAALFWSVGGNTLEAEFHEDGSFYLRARPTSGDQVENAEGDADAGFPTGRLRTHLRLLSDMVVASRVFAAVG